MKRAFKNNTERIETYLDIQAGVNKDPDGAVPNYSKVCDVKFGDWVEIIWQGNFEGTVDRGYVLGWPSYPDPDANMAGVVHIPHPQNPGGVGDVEAEWITLYELRTNPLVEKVKNYEHQLNDAKCEIISLKQNLRPGGDHEP